MFPTAILTALLLALTVAASPVVQVYDSPIRLSFSRRFNTTSARNLLQNDRKRVTALKARAKAILGDELTVEEAAIANQPVEDQVVKYIASVGVGSPATTYDLLIDTGSSNTWIGAKRKYVPTSTSVPTNNTVKVQYGSGSFKGNEFVDTVTLGPLVIPRQSIGVATRASGLGGSDGILGIGPADLTRGSLSPDSKSVIHTVTDNLISNGDLANPEIGIFSKPSNTADSFGEISWGGTDPSKFDGTINFTPRTSASPAKFYWGIDQSIRYGSSATIMANTAGIIDTGTTLLYLPSDAFISYRQATGAVIDRNTGLLRLTSAQFQNLESLFFNIHGTTYELTPDAQIWPRVFNSYLGGSSDSIYLIVNDMGSPSGEGFDFISGKVFLERFYSVYNSADGSVGFATTAFTKSKINQI